MYGTYSLLVHKRSLQETITLLSLADTKSIVKPLVPRRVLTFRKHGRTTMWHDENLFNNYDYDI